MSSAELVLNTHPSLGEGPVWDVRRARLLWVDLLGGAVHVFDPATGRDHAIEAGRAVGAVVPRRDGSWFVFGADSILTLDPETETLAAVHDFESETPARRSNDAQADPFGRVWFGRLAWRFDRGAGRLERLDTSMVRVPVFTGLAIPNGIGWSPDARTMYFSESTARTLTAFDFDEANGPTNPRVLLGPDAFDALGGVPDGLTVDAEGHVWLAVWGGRCLVRVSPTGAVVDRVDLPVSQVSSCAFGGPDLADLYVTTARADFSPEDDAREPLAGGLFLVRPGVRGLHPRLAF